MNISGFDPFENDDNVLRLGDLFVENGMSSILLTGSLEVGGDIQSKERLDTLIDLLFSIRQAIALGKCDLVNQPALTLVETVKSPFD